jgi:probable phosphoglycerate mutase
LRAKKIYLIRHGQTEYNKLGIVQGSGVNIGLNEKGRRQAEAFFQAYHSVPFDKIYSSALLRAKETVQPFVDAGHRYESYSGLNEINWGNKEGQRIDIQENAYYQAMLHAWQQGQTDVRIEGGESPQDVQLRIRPVLREILEDNSTSTILICMHGRSMRILLATLLQYPLAYMDLFRHENLCLYTLLYTGSLCRVIDYCNTDHLQVLKGS